MIDFPDQIYKSNEMTHFKPLFLLASIVLCLQPTAIAQYTLTDDDVVVTSGYITSCSYNFEQTDIIIPDTLDNQRVRKIKDGAGNIRGVFENKGITSVSLPSTIEYIGRYAFYKNEITSISLDSCTKLRRIESGAFRDNPLPGWTLPANEEYPSLNWKDGYGQTYLPGDSVTDFYTTLRVPIVYKLKDGNVKIENGIIKSCSYNFEYIDIILPDTIQDQKVIGIKGFSSGYDAVFAYKRIATLVLPATLEYIGVNAFSNNSLSELDLSQCVNLLRIESRAFDNNHFNKLVLPTHIEYFESGWKDGPGNHYIGQDTIENFETIYYIPVPHTLTDEDVVVEDGIIQSCSYSFIYGEITIPDTLDGQLVTGIADKPQADGVFSIKLFTGISLPPSIEFIGDNAFLYNLISEIELGELANLVSIGRSAFDMNELSSLDLSGCEKLSSIGPHAFSSNGLLQLDLSECTSLISIGAFAFDNNNISTLDLSGLKISYIDENAFSTNAISNLKLDNCTSLKRIGDDAFIFNEISHFDFNGLDSLKFIGVYAFAENNIDSIDFSACPSLDTIGTGAFASSNLLKIDFTGCSNLSYIGNTVFHSQHIEEIDLSSCTSLQYIGSNAFHFTEMAGFSLPIPILPGKEFAYWKDDLDQYYTGGQWVDDLTLSYTAEFGKGYIIKFIITDGENPVEGAEVALSGYGELTTDENGIAEFTTLLPQSNIEYSVSADGFQLTTGTVTVVDSDITESLTLLISGISEQEERLPWFYPNPANSYVILNVDAGEILSITDASGRIVYSEQVNTNPTIIPISHLDRGLYLIKVETKGKPWGDKLLIE